MGVRIRYTYLHSKRPFVQKQSFWTRMARKVKEFFNV